MAVKGTIIFVMYPEISAFNATLKFAKMLENTGYRIIYVGDGRDSLQYMDYITNQGFEYKLIDVDFLPYNQLLSEYDKELASCKGNIRKKLLMIGFTNVIFKYMFYNYLRKTNKLIKEVKPNLIIIDQLCAFYSAPYLREKIPVVYINTCLSSTFSFLSALTKPPVFSNIIPSRKNSILKKVLFLFSWLRLVGKNRIRRAFYKNLIRISYGFKKKRIFIIEKELKALGAKIKYCEYSSGSLGFFRIEGPELVTCPVEFDFPINNDNRIYIGTCVDDERKDGVEFDWEKINNTMKLAYCSLGSYQNQFNKKTRNDFNLTIINAFKKIDGFQLIIQISNDDERDNFKIHTNDKIIVERWVPQIEILYRADLFITHGGLSSIRESILTGTPMIVFPTGIDRYGNASRVVFHALGLKGDFKTIDIDSVILKVNEIMKNKKYQESVKKMQRVFYKQKKCQKGVKFIEALIKNG